MKKYKIIINFNNTNLDGIIEQLRIFLVKEHVFEYDDDTNIRDLFEWIMYKIWDDSAELDDEKLREHLSVVLDERNIMVQLDYNLKKFINTHNIRILKLNYVMCSFGGAGVYIKVLGSIRINPNEQNHKYIPHVHIYKNKRIANDSCIRINLEDLTQMTGDKKTIDDLFIKSNKEYCMKF
ncbi:MAG: hypothetical protein V8Q75_01925 [Bacilli bacterium]